MTTASPRTRLVRAALAALLLQIAAIGSIPAAPAAGAAMRCARSDRPFGVGRVTLLIPVGSGRALSTTVLYPSVQGTAGVDVRPACGEFPLVLAAHGAQGTGASAADLHAFLVHAGYVVAAPTFAGGLDMTRAARDASRVISGILARDRAGGQPFSGHLRRSRVGWVGTSFGGMVGLTLYRDCCRDRRVDAVIAKLATAYGSGYQWRAGPPLVMMNGTADTIVSYTDAVATYERAARPKGLITLHGLGHSLDVGDDPVLRDSSLGFFGRFLKGNDRGLTRLRRAVERSPIATLRASW